MSRYLVRVVELRSYECEYVIEAENATEAWTKARRGETLEERDIEMQGVAERVVLETPREWEEDRVEQANG